MELMRVHACVCRGFTNAIFGMKKDENKPNSALFQFGTVPCVPYTIHFMQGMEEFFHYWRYSSIFCVFVLGGFSFG